MDIIQYQERRRQYIITDKDKLKNWVGGSLFLWVLFSQQNEDESTDEAEGEECSSSYWRLKETRGLNSHPEG